MKILYKYFLFMTLCFVAGSPIVLASDASTPDLSFQKSWLKQRLIPCELYLLNGQREELAVETPRQIMLFRNLVAKALARLPRDVQDPVTQYIDKLIESRMSLRPFARYFLEGWLASWFELQSAEERLGYYSSGMSINDFKKILKLNSFQDLHGMDFGFGDASTMRVLNNAGAVMIGYDLSPFFVTNARKVGLSVYVAEIDAEPKEFKSQFGIEPGSQDFVLSTLILDRVAKPKDHIKNLFLALKSKGRFAVQTLLPIIPEDDGPVAHKIQYTAPQNRITSGKSISEDTKQLLEVIKDLGGVDIEVQKLKYTVHSSDGEQQYVLWSFSGIKQR